MNEQLIERLFIEAQKQITSKTTKDFANKFTELIVRECAKVILAKAADYPDTDEWHDWTNGMDQAQADILVHFGVEE